MKTKGTLVLIGCILLTDCHSIGCCNLSTPCCTAIQRQENRLNVVAPTSSSTNLDGRRDADEVGILGSSR
ncbi:hypothetical protein SAMN06265222_101955 [Neorhodopirellula lusitana]|uniref:Secreted protein n=1 Tax=Neorhodopirellula lusitana TaxID=445327 RepID=A0ABY1PR86_9BACT|nr:hypothetical protein SAMN06265222_101955 [Neorhodopirellula lusitana]